MTDNCGCSALHHAAWSGRAKVVQLLLRHGVDSKLMDSYHRCASDLSVSNEIRKLLISHLNYTPEKRKILEPVEEKSHQKENFKKILSPESNLETKFYVSFSDLKTNPEILIEQSLSIFNGKQEIELESSVVGLEMSFPTKIDLVSLDRTIPVETGISFASSSSSTAVGSSLRSEKVTNSQLEIFNPFLVDDWSTSFTQDLCNISGLNLLRNNSSISSSIQNDFLSRRDDMMYYTKRKSVPNNDKIIEMPTTIDSTLKFSLPPVVAKYYNQSNTLVSTVGISKTTEKYLQKKQIHKIQAETMNNLNSKLFGADPFESGNGTLLTEKEYSSFDSSKGLNLVSKVNLNSVPKRIKTFIRPKSSSGLNESEPYELTDLANSASNSSYVAEFASIKDVSKNLPDNNLNVGISHKSKINQNITSDMPKLEKHLQRRQKHILRAFELEVESGLSFEDD